MRKEGVQDVIDHQVVLLLKARMRDPGHYRELLVRIRQALEELQDVVERCNAVVLAAKDQRWNADAFRIDA